jgi:hypothetical protein
VTIPHGNVSDRMLQCSQSSEPARLCRKHPAGRVGLWSNSTQFSASNFRVVALASSPTSVVQSSCSSNWSGGLDGWTGTGDWSSSGGALLDDGTNYNASVTSSCRPSSANYAVQVGIAVSQTPCCGSFGIHVRTNEGGDGGYGVGYSYEDGALEIWNGTTSLASAPYDPGSGQHTYRVQVTGNSIQFYVDGGLALQATDNQYLDPGRIGLWSNSTGLSAVGFQMNVG